MIQNIPIGDDFFRVGLSLLHMGWDVAIGLQSDLDHLAEEVGEWIREDVEHDYWVAARQPLASALATAHQGAEFLLKGRIVSISPYLLIIGSPRDWPAKCDKEDTPFGDFRTIDAQDLVRVHDTFSNSRLSQEIVTSLETLRRQRNAIMHTVDHRVDVRPLELMLTILEIHHYFFPGESWITARRNYLESTPTSALHSTDGVEAALIAECSDLVELLEPAQLLKFFNFNKKQRRYICPECRHKSGDAELSPKTAVLRPNEPDSKTVWCFICDQEQAVERMDCPDPDCRGNVISVEHQLCLTCEGTTEIE